MNEEIISVRLVQVLMSGIVISGHHSVILSFLNYVTGVRKVMMRSKGGREGGGRRKEEE